MKRLFILLTAIGLLNTLGGSVIAQTPFQRNGLHGLNLFRFHHARPAYLQNKLPALVQNRYAGEKPTQTRSRMKTLTYYSSYDTLNMAFVPEDSVRLFWEGANHQDNLDRYLLNNLIFYPGYSFFFTPDNNVHFAIQSDSALYYSWDDSLSVYSPMRKQRSILDSNGNLISQTYFNYNGTNWDLNGKITYTYDANGNVTAIINQSWSGSVWRNSNKTIYSYNTSNQLTESVDMLWDSVSSNWVNSYKYIFSYDNQNHLVNEIDQQWITSSNAWENQNQYSANYANSLLASEVSQSWNNSTNQWEADNRVNYDYSNSGQNTGFIVQSWDGNAWENEGKASYIYAGDLVQTVTIENWVDNLGQFVNVEKLDYSYNNYNQCTLAESFSWEGAQWSHTFNESKLTFIYENYDDGTGIKNALPEAAFQLYPNPTAENMNVTMTKGMINGIQILDISGKIVYASKTALNAEKVMLPTSQLADGAYYLRITSGERHGTQKFVVVH